MTPVKRRMGMFAAMIALAAAAFAHEGAYQRKSKRLPGWGIREGHRRGGNGRHRGASGGQLKRYAFPEGYGAACRLRYYDRSVRHAQARAAQETNA